MAVLARQSVEYQQAHIHQDFSKGLNVYYVILCVLVTVLMAMRVASRKIMNMKLERDDWTFLAGAAIAGASFIVSLIYTFDAGLGKHWIALTSDQQDLFRKLNYAFDILNLSCYPLIKLSILLLYLRIFTANRFRVHRFRQLCWAGVVFVSAMCIANTLVACFSCNPVRSFYDTSVKGTCIQDVPFYWATAILNVVTDLYILVLPLPTIWEMNITFKRKITISLIFMLGGLTFVVSIIRIFNYLDYTASDPSYSYYGTTYSTPGEVSLAILVASAATWRPVWIYTRQMSVSVYRRLSNTDSGTDTHASTDISRTSRFDLSASHTHARRMAMSQYTTDSDSSTLHPEDGTDASRKTSATYVGDLDSGASSDPNLVLYDEKPPILKPPPRAVIRLTSGISSHASDTSDMSITPADVSH